ncbi:MAG: 16S rRNA (cytosine(1402)-N(4))-methyltransferase RsmH [Clostridia bacterium]|nr:16S rRNA (cytosine(1402)-N(4))-methyltransferase RsmH [Clostridia bacterium]
MTEFKHISVLLSECIDGLNIRPDGIYADGTLGGGGHSSVIYSHLITGKLIGIDRDIEAIDAASKRIGKAENIIYVHDNYKNIKNILFNNNISGLDGALVDLGISSYQIDNAERGFSYTKDAPLDMRMNQSDPLSAYDVVNTYETDKLAKVIFDYGEERYGRKIADSICKARAKKPIETTLELAEIIKSAVPAKSVPKGSHPAKRTFQAIRIEVNGELADLKGAVTDFFECLNPGGRLCIITFHSLEDRIVKHVFADFASGCTCPKEFPVCVCGKQPQGKLISRKPILPSAEELASNSRSASAKLRIIEKL